MPITWNKGPIPNLKQELKDAKKNKDWFNAIIHSAIQLEKYGYILIREYLEFKEGDLSPFDEVTKDEYYAKLFS